MARTCTVCRHPDRQAVNAALVASEPERAIARRFGLGRCAVQRHKADHLPVLLTKAVATAELIEASTLVGRMETLERKALSILSRAEQAGDLRTALAAIREARGVIDLLGRAQGAFLQRDQTEANDIFRDWTPDELDHFAQTGEWPPAHDHQPARINHHVPLAPRVVDRSPAVRTEVAQVSMTAPPPQLADYRELAGHHPAPPEPDMRRARPTPPERSTALTHRGSPSSPEARQHIAHVRQVFERLDREDGL